ncbi:putative uncharacterized protein DDB_G0293878, partial [Actinia tenebrosa]|uniref:Uncharacterized protein n=1 Tax=Actinia tenebrosa TaxID=6105 RepID=A0A6P8HSN8_ACTTE
MTPNYPTLTPGNRANVTFVFSSPTKPVVFTPLSNKILFNPSSCLIDPNKTKNGEPFVTINMTVSSVVIGDHLVKYSLSGPDSYIYNMPSPDVVSVVGHNSSCGSNQTFPKGCYTLEYRECTGINASVVLYSTSQWKYIGKGIATDGIVSLNNLPVSTSGINLPSGKAIQGSSVTSCSSDSSKSKCSLSSIFATQFLHSVGTSFPSWFGIRTTRTSDYNINDVQTYLWTGKQLLSVIGNDKVTVGADKLFSVLLITDETILQVRQSTLRLSPSTKSKPHVVAVELCSKTERPNVIVALSLLSFYQIQTMDMQKIFGSSGWQLSFIYVQFSLDKTISRSEFLDSQQPLVGNLELFGGLNATLKNNESIVVRGSTLFDADIEKLSNALPSQWQADVRGAITISMFVDYQSGPEPLIIEFSKIKSSIKHQESLVDTNSGCRQDGQTNMLIKGLLNGKTLNSSTISSYLEVTDNMQAFASINMKKNHYNFKHKENDTNNNGTNNNGPNNNGTNNNGTNNNGTNNNGTNNNGTN